MKTITLTALYKKLFACYGPQGWWPIPTLADTPGFDSHGYHQGDYSFPQTKAQVFEIIAGAVLTQNTTWKNAEKALTSMKMHGLLDPAAILRTEHETLAKVIHSSGYHNQKAKKLRIITRFFTADILSKDRSIPDRARLLDLWGIGPETADSILLYGFGIPVFVVDAYTHRLLSRLGIITDASSYSDIQTLFHKQIKPLAETCNEFHALIVQHAKEHCMKKPACSGCPLADRCALLPNP